MGSTRFSKNPDPRLSPVNTRPARGARVLGMWSAAATYIVFDLGVILDPMLSSPWDVWVPIGASALIAPSFVLLTVSIHYSCSTAAKVWTHSSTLFAAIYAALAEIVYVTWLFVVHPRALSGREEEVQLLVFGPGTFMQMVDAAAYTLMGMAIALTAAAFAGSTSRWQRWLALANGPAAILVFVSYLTYDMVFGAPAGILVPAYAISVFLWFRKA